MKQEIATAKKFFEELKTVANWNFEDFQEDVEKAIDNFLYTDFGDGSIKEVVEELITDKLYKVFRDAIVAASTDEEKEDEKGIEYVAREWTFLAYERGEKFATEQEIYDSVKDDVEYARR